VAGEKAAARAAFRASVKALLAQLADAMPLDEVADSVAAGVVQQRLPPYGLPPRPLPPLEAPPPATAVLRC